MFPIDASRVPAGETQATVQLFKDGVPVANCSGPAGTASPDPCVSLRELLADGDICLTALTSTASDWTFGIALVVPVAIDLKLGSDPNTIRLDRAELVPVAILSTPSFDARTVDPASVCFGDAEAPGERDCSESHGRGHLRDVGGDGDIDLLLHFKPAATGIDLGDTQACLTGRTRSGTPIRGCDKMRVR